MRLPPNIEKVILKAAVGIAGSALLGTIWKGEKEIQGMISEHYKNLSKNN